MLRPTLKKKQFISFTRVTKNYPLKASIDRDALRTLIFYIDRDHDFISRRCYTFITKVFGRISKLP